MIGEPHVRTLLLSAGAGLLLAALYAASPLTLWVLIAAPLLIVLLGRGLPAAERRVLILILAVAFSARAAFVAAMFLADIPHLNDLSIGGLAGDEAYYLSRAIRSRDLVLGFTHTTYDYFVANDEYGRTSYLRLLTGLQLAFGPTPYSMRLLNGLLFVSGATVLFRIARTAFGAVPALAGLTAVLFLPSLFVMSVSLLKEPLYFLVASVLLASAVRAMRAVRARNIASAAAALAVTAACLWLVNDLRRGGLVLAAAGLGLGVAIRLLGGHRWRLAAAAFVLALVSTAALSQPSLRARVLGGVTSAAKTHAGHVFTVGHSYKLMDEGFYATPEEPSGWDLMLTEPQAFRFVSRALVSFLVTPLPWEMRSLRELAFLPEHLFWYVLLALVPAGVVAGWRRDPLVTSLWLGFGLPTAVALALTTGNVGTLLRLRGLVTPYLVWLAALGLCALIDARSSRRVTHPLSRESRPSEGLVP